MTLFDVITVACFGMLVIGYFTLAGADRRQLPHFLLSGVVLAIANQVGNADRPAIAALLVIIAVTYAPLMSRLRRP